MTTAVTRRELLAWALAIALAITAVVATRDHAGAGVSGPTSEVVYIATGENFPDALGAAATAALGPGPVLLTQQNTIPFVTLNELTRLQPPKIVVVGGQAVISSEVEAQLNALVWSPEVVRIGGANRFETAAMLSSSVFPSSGKYPRAAFDQTSGGLLGFGGGTALSADIEAPAAGILVITASAEGINTTSFGVACQLHAAGVGTIAERTLENEDDTSCALNTSYPVAAGNHTVILQVAGPPMTISVGNGDLSVVWIPFDGEGGVPTP